MTNKKISKESIRKQAENRINSMNNGLSQQIQKLSLNEVQKIVHDLEIHQIELEIQNEELVSIEKELEKAEKRYYDLYQMAPISYCTLNQAGFIQEVNITTSNLLGMDYGEVINRPLSNFIFKEDQDIYYMFRKKFFISDKKEECEIRMVKADKTVFWANLAVTGEADTNKEPLFRLIINDISERKINEEQLELLASVFKNAGEGIMITNLDGIISDVNETFTKITGYTKEEVVGKKPTILSSGLQNIEYYREMWKSLIINDSWTGEMWNKRKDGELFAEMLIINKIYDKKGKASHFVGIFSDITNIKKYQNSLKDIAHFDQLTKLPNRVLLADRLESGMLQAKRNKRHLAVVFLDLDGFKEINDNYGHDAGDKLLIALAKEMKLALREVDTLARIGGDEFVAVLFDLVQTSDALPIINRLLKATSKKILIEDHSVQVSASIGVTFCPENQIVDPDQLLRQADQSMYQAKLSGKNRYHFFNEEENNLMSERFEGIEQIRQALENEEFILHYQPKINMREGKVIGLEAFLRWENPQEGIILPLEFLQIVEGHSLSINIGEWVLNTVLSQIVSWQKIGISLPISINIASKQLLEEGFVNRLSDILSLYPTVKPNMLEFEVLETNRFEDLSKVKYVMNSCIKLGITFSLDNFGTGYSSLLYLKQLPIKQIKIDQSFVHDMINNPDDLSILEGIISLGEAFQSTVIAEGVETSEHAMTLLSLGCELGQGYIIADPMPEKEIITWLKKYKPNTLWQNQTLINSKQRQILFIKVQHRAWVENIKAILDYKEDIYRYKEKECTFGEWLKNNAKECLGNNYESIELKHKNIHIYADKILNLHYNGRHEDALAGLDELDRLLEDILDELDKDIN